MPALPRVPAAALAVAAASLSMSACAASRPHADGPREMVVLVHGMGRTTASMAPLEVSLRHAGYRVLNVGYSSTGPSVAEIGQGLDDVVDQAIAEEVPPRVHFVGHSLGTVAIRWLLANDPPGVTGRAVFLAPPNQGSHSADRWARWIGWSLRPIRELRTTGGTAVELRAPPHAEIAVIAGDHDGKVSVDETCLDGAAHAVVPSRHTFIMVRPRVLGMVRQYLATGVLPGASDAPCAAVLAEGDGA